MPPHRSSVPHPSTWSARIMTTMNAATTWDATLGQLQMVVTRANYDTWLRDTIGLRHEDGRFVIGAQSAFATEWLTTRLRPLITKTLAGVLGHGIDVAFEVSQPAGMEPPVLLSEPDGAAEGDRPAGARSVAPPQLNAALTFDAFVVGDENRLAFEAARRVVAEPGALNPLTIFAAPGLGKTHLLQAIGHAAYAAGRSVIYASAERFGNDFVRALKDGLDHFRRRYRGADVLLIDDIQFFEGRDGFEKEFFHTFNDLHAQGKQIVVTTDRAPAALTGLTEAMRTRLQWGLVADVQRPAFDTRLAILRAKARRHAVRLPESALEMIAERCCPTVRELEGSLNRVLAFVPLIGGAVTRETIDRALSPLVPLSQREAEPPCPNDIIAAVCRHLGVQLADLRGRSRNRDVSYARHLAMYVLKEDGRKTVAEIGRTLGHRDHSTVLAGIQRIALEQTTRPETRADLGAVRAALDRSSSSAAAAG
ncbi:MAG: chromosomal replication initiator protein DnaA [Dehalococcoidia bacterium]|nr:MAG: chromosomal replication initiator protein DnaA [Dehalococcoidia bacterium]